MTREPREAVLLRDVRTLFHLGVVGGSSDGQLLEQFLDADAAASEAAFAVLVERDGAMVMHVCRQVLDDPDDAQDAFQATFLVLLRRAGSIRKRDSVASWLFGVALRVSRRARYAAVVRRFHERRGGAFASARARSKGESSECRAALHEEIARLPDRYREALVLCHLEGLSTAVAARRLGCAHGTILSRLARARERLRRRLAGRGLTVPVGLFMAGLVPRDVAAASAAGRAALAATASPAVSSLTRTTLRSLLMSRLTLAAGVLATIAALAGVAIPWGHASRGAVSPAAAAAGRVQQPPAGGQGFGGPGIPAGPRGMVSVPMDSDTTLSVAYSPDGKTLVMAGFHGAIDLWDVLENRKLGVLQGDRAIVRAVTFAADGRTLASVGDEGIVRLWDLPSGTMKQAFPGVSESMRQAARGACLYSVAFNPDGRMLAVASGAGINREVPEPLYEVTIFDGQTGKAGWSHRDRGEWVFSLAFAPDGRAIACAGMKAVTLRDARTGKPLQTLKPTRGGISAVAYAPDGRKLIGGGPDSRPVADSRRPAGLATIWDVATGQVLHTLEFPSGDVRTIAVSPDGKTVAAGGNGPWRQTGNFHRHLGEVRLWDIATGKLLWTYEGEGNETGSLAFSPDGRMLVYCDMQSVGMIDVQTGRLARILKTTTMTPKR